MKPFYSIIKVLIRPSIKEYISIGLLFGSEGNKPFMALADDKIKVAKTLLPMESWQLLALGIEDLRAKIEPESSDFKLYTLLAEPSENYLNSSEFTAGFVNYLSRYQNNLLRFSTPVEIDLDFGLSQFHKLFSIYVSDSKLQVSQFDYPKEKQLVQSKFEKLDEEFYPRISSRINHNFRITKNILPTLAQPQTVDLIGRNGAVVVGKEIDFSGFPSQIGRQTTDLYALIKAFEFNQETNGTYFVIGEEPPKESRKRWELWDTIKESKQIQFVDLDETEQIVEYVFSHDVHPIAIER